MRYVGEVQKRSKDKASGWYAMIQDNTQHTVNQESSTKP